MNEFQKHIFTQLTHNIISTSVRRLYDVAACIQMNSCQKTLNVIKQTHIVPKECEKNNFIVFFHPNCCTLNSWK